MAPLIVHQVLHGFAGLFCYFTKIYCENRTISGGFASFPAVCSLVDYDGQPEFIHLCISALSHLVTRLLHNHLSCLLWLINWGEVGEGPRRRMTKKNGGTMPYGITGEVNEEERRYGHHPHTQQPPYSPPFFPRPRFQRPTEWTDRRTPCPPPPTPSLAAHTDRFAPAPLPEYGRFSGAGLGRPAESRLKPVCRVGVEIHGEVVKAPPRGCPRISAGIGTVMAAARCGRAMFPVIVFATVLHGCPVESRVEPKRKPPRGFYPRMV